MTDSIAPHLLGALAGTQISTLEKNLILKHKILGFTLFKRNIESLEQLLDLNTELQALAKQAGYELILSVDQEGGRVFRLPEPFPKIPPMREWGKKFDETQDATLLYKLGQMLAEQVYLTGFNMDFAPLIDVDLNPDSPIIGDRSFSSSAEAVYLMARQVIRGFENKNVLTCLKHYPGHGFVNQDSHLTLPIDERDPSEIKKIDLLPYKKLIAENLAPSVMTAHVSYPKWDSNNPATLSPTILGHLRTQLNYDGVIFSDDYLMKAIFDNYDLTDALHQFFKADGDAALICDKPDLIEETIIKYDQNYSQSSTLTNSKKRLQELKKRFSILTTPLSLSQIKQALEKHQNWLNQVF